MSDMDSELTILSHVVRRILRIILALAYAATFIIGVGFCFVFLVAMARALLDDHPYDLDGTDLTPWVTLLVVVSVPIAVLTIWSSIVHRMLQPISIGVLISSAIVLSMMGWQSSPLGQFATKLWFAIPLLGSVFLLIASVIGITFDVLAPRRTNATLSMSPRHEPKVNNKLS